MLEEALQQPQPRSAWGRARLDQVKKDLGERWAQGLLAVVQNPKSKAERRVRALELLQVYGPIPSESVLAHLGNDPRWEVRAASTYYLGMRHAASARTELVKRLKDTDPFVRRRACEALIRNGIDSLSDPGFSPSREVLPLLSDSDRWLRFAARLVLERTNRNLWKTEVLKLSDDTRPALNR